jgi:hypothetical protein
MPLQRPVKMILSPLNHLKTPRMTRRFAAHNRRIFARKSVALQPKSIVLFELNTMHSAHISYGYLANVLAEKHGAEIVAYNPKGPQNLKQKLAFQIKKTIGYEHFGVYRSFGAVDFWDVSTNSSQKSCARELVDKLYFQLEVAADVEALNIDGVRIGDLIYDTYLRKNSVPTIDPKSPEFRQHFQESLELFIVWKDYFDTHDVRAINISHCVYNLALPLRLAVQRGIPVYQINATHLYRMTERNMFAYNDFHYFPERFADLPPEVQKVGLAEAKRRIGRRLSGEVGVDMSYSTKSAYGATRKKRLLRKSSRKKILIATHCFFDSPHSYGNNLFPDFYEWLDFLGKITESTNYDWYIKTHPDYLAGTKEIIDNFIKLYPRFTLLPANSSHHQIVAEGIDVALTVYGTIGFEYAALEVPVINASRNNPHISYNFNIHPKNIEEYEEVLLNLKNLDINIDQKQVYEYYFMRHIYNTENIFFGDYSGMLKKLGGYSGQFSPAVYGLWCDEFSPAKHKKIYAALEKFVDSGDFRMDYTHFDQEFSTRHIGV